MTGMPKGRLLDLELMLKRWSSERPPKLVDAFPQLRVRAIVRLSPSKGRFHGARGGSWIMDLPLTVLSDPIATDTYG
jgi:hypothetical protein